MFVSAQGTVSQKGIRDLSYTRAYQYRMFSVSCSLQKMLIIALFTYFSHACCLCFQRKIKQYRDYQCAAVGCGGGWEGQGRATQSRTSHDATVAATLHHVWKPCFTDLYISLTVSLSVDAEEHVIILMNPFSLSEKYFFQVYSIFISVSLFAILHRLLHL